MGALVVRTFEEKTRFQANRVDCHNYLIVNNTGASVGIRKLAELYLQVWSDALVPDFSPSVKTD